MKQNVTVYISNMSEDVWPFISAMSTSYAREMEIQENARLSEHDLFSFFGFDNVLIIVPKFPDTDCYQYFRGLSKNNNLEVLSTRIHTGEISKDIMQDQEVLDAIKQLSQSYEKVNLISYCASVQFLDLALYLKTFLPNIVLSESPEFADSWTVDFYGSKSGIRQLSQQYEADEPDFKMADGLISVAISNSIKIAANLYTKNGGIVLKTNKGHSGAGVLILRPDDLPHDYSACEKIISKLLDKERYWKLFPIILEKYIEPSHTIGGGYPNVEFKIHKNGRIELLYYCSCRVTEKGVFKGIEIHNDVLSDQVSAQIVDTGFFIGEKYVKQGYRGYFDVDFIAAKNGELYVTESNTRRTGGTHVYYLAKELFGKDFMHEVYTVSNNLYEVNNKKHIESKDLMLLLKPVLFDKKKMEGLIVTGTSLLGQKAFGYVIFGKTRSRAIKIEKQMEQLVTSF